MLQGLRSENTWNKIELTLRHHFKLLDEKKSLGRTKYRPLRSFIEKNLCILCRMELSENFSPELKLSEEDCLAVLCVYRDLKETQKQGCAKNLGKLYRELFLLARKVIFRREFRG